VPTEVLFSTLGLPAAQGSKTPWGTEANPKLASWRNDMRLAAYLAMKGQPPFHGPVALRATFTFPRPKSHFRTGRHAGEVKESAPGWKPSTPDLDKLVRALGDAMSGVVIRDDAQIVDLAVTKIYGQKPGVVVKVRPLH